MRHETMPSDLPILGAEQYLDGSFAAKKIKAKKPPASKPESSPRKRAKISHPAAETGSAEDGDDDGAKRARGRPRLDTKDKTAAERRRTQIRLAQRAYRSRKENAIQTLERRVEELQKNNEELSNVFLKLHDSAVNLGVLDQAPDFALALRAATEKILVLAKRSSEDGVQDEQAEFSTLEQPSHHVQTGSSSPLDVADAQPAHDTTVPLWGGYMVTNELEIKPPNDPITTSSSAMPPVNQAPLGYEVVTMPTFENASFPFDLSPESPFPDILDQVSTSTPAYPLSPYSALPLPHSGSFGESTFGRRLQRRSLELAYQLLSMPDPPKQMYAEVFGFCMLFEPVDKIRERLSCSLTRTASESLNWWQAPFWAAGGSGQHQLQQDGGGGGGTRVGNQGTVDHMKYSLSEGQFGLGPFGGKVSEIRDKRIDPRMRIRLPGFEGDFYDPDEVEMYLQTRGIIIQPGQDYLTTEVDVDAFGNAVAAEQRQRQAVGGLREWPQALDDAFNPPAGGGPSPSDSSAMAPASTSSALSETRMDSSPWPVGDFGEMFSGAASGQDGSGASSSSGSAPGSRKRLVTLDVNVFIKELTNRGTCLGRSPGFRPRDVDASFWIATKTDAALGF